MTTPDLVNLNAEVQYYLNEKYEKKIDKKLNQVLFQVSKAKSKALITSNHIFEFYDDLKYNDNTIFYSFESKIEMGCYLNNLQMILVDQQNKYVNPI